MSPCFSPLRVRYRVSAICVSSNPCAAGWGPDGFAAGERGASTEADLPRSGRPSTAERGHDVERNHDAAIGVITGSSPLPVVETVDRLAAAARMAGNTIFARIDHAANATAAGLTMPPTQVLIFGNGAAGTPLMLASPLVALDLPLRFLVWQADGETRVSWSDPLYYAARYALKGHEPQLAAMGRALAGFAASVG